MALALLPTGVDQRACMGKDFFWIDLSPQMIECTNGFKPLNWQCVQKNSLASLEAKKKPKDCSPAAMELKKIRVKTLKDKAEWAPPPQSRWGSSKWCLQEIRDAINETSPIFAKLSSPEPRSCSGRGRSQKPKSLSNQIECNAQLNLKIDCEEGFPSLGHCDEEQGRPRNKSKDNNTWVGPARNGLGWTIQSWVSKIEKNKKMCEWRTQLCIYPADPNLWS